MKLFESLGDIDILSIRLAGAVTAVGAPLLSLAQETGSSTAFASIGGWAGTGLLGLVLGTVLLKTIPDMLKSISDMQAKSELKDDKFLNQLKEQQEKHDADREKDRRDANEALNKVLNHCSKEIDKAGRESLGHEELRRLREELARASKE